MAPRRTGSVRFRNGVWYVGLRLRSRLWYERKLEQPKDGGPYDETYARLAAATLSRKYQTGDWDPESPQAPQPTGNPLALDYVTAWVAKQTYETAPKDVSQVKRYFTRAPIAGIKVRDVKPRDAAAWIDWLLTRRSRKGGNLSASAVRNAFDLVQRAFDAAVFDELLPSNPLHAARKLLPQKTDKNATAREGWTFTRAEIATLIASPLIKRERRLRYALLFLTGMRFGESSALRWRDYESTEPLSRITVRRAIKSVSRKEGTTKTRARKLVPVHPTLLPILADWYAVGWRAAFGRDPTPDDLVIPSVRGKMKGQPANSSACNRAFKADQKLLKMRERHQHVARHAFISLAQDDGADGSILRWVTHAPPKSAFDGYSRAQWTRLCEEVAKLRIAV